jgi:capsular polysaccharide biosynthesis protein
MTAQEYLDIITRRWRLIGALLLIGLVLGLVLTLITTPLYRASIKVSVNPSRPEYGTALTINTLLSNFSLQLTTVKLAQDVVDQLRLDVAPETLVGRLKVTPQQDNFMLLIEADNADPRTAERIATTVATTFVNQYTAANAEASRQDRIDVSLLDDVEPAKLSKPRAEINIAAGALAGLLLGIVLAFVLEYLDDTIKTVDDIERILSMRSVGAIPAGKTQVMNEENP